jgi:hypothetical protein
MAGLIRWRDLQNIAITETEINFLAGITVNAVLLNQLADFSGTGSLLNAAIAASSSYNDHIALDLASAHEMIANTIDGGVIANNTITQAKLDFDVLDSDDKTELEDNISSLQTLHDQLSIQVENLYGIVFPSQTGDIADQLVQLLAHIAIEENAHDASAISIENQYDLISDSLIGATSAEVSSSAINFFMEDDEVEFNDTGSGPEVRILTAVDTDLNIISWVTPLTENYLVANSATVQNNNTANVQQSLNRAFETLLTHQGRLDDLDAADILLDGRLDTAESDINNLESADTALDGRLDIVETDLSTAQDDIDALESDVATLISDVSGKIDLTEKGAALGVATLDANQLIPITQIPPAALERLVIVADEAAKYALTLTTIQNGDTVRQTDTDEMFFVKDDTQLNNAAGYAPYSAGIAASVPWSGVTATPTTLAGYGITDYAAEAKAAAVSNSITNGITDVAPSQDAVFDALVLKADLASPSLTGNPTAPTQTPADNSTKIATTAYVDTAVTGATIPDADAVTKGKIQLAGDLSGTAASPTVPGLTAKANLASPALTGNPTAPTQTAGDNSTKIATTAYVETAVGAATIPDADALTKGKIQLAGDLGGTAASPTVPGLTLKADLASPTFTGVPAAPTASPGTNTTQVATTAFVTAAVTGGTTGITGIAGETLAINDLVYISLGTGNDSGRTAGRIYKLDALFDERINFVGFITTGGIAGAVVTAKNSNTLSGFAGLTSGQLLWLDTSTPGTYTQTEPLTLDAWIIRVGVAISTSEVLPLPDQAATAYYNQQTQFSFTIANNQVAASDVTDLIFDGTVDNSFSLDYSIARSSSLTSLAQAGRLRGIYNATTISWILSDDFTGDNAGVTFSITAAGQIKYTSTNITGTGYVGTLSYEVGLAAKANASHTHPLSEITQSGATLGQVPEWDGLNWVPADPSGGGAAVIDSIADADTINAPSRNAVFDALALKAPLASPALTGSPTAPTQTALDNSTKIATTAYTDAAVAAIPASSSIGALDINWASGNLFYKSISVDSTFTFSNVTDGRTITIMIENTAGTAKTITLPTTMRVAGTITIDAGKEAMLTFARTNSKTYMAIVNTMESV